MKACFRLVGLALVVAALCTEACDSNPTALSPVAVVRITPDSATLVMAGTRQLTATPQDASGKPLPDRAVTWQSSDGAVATVSGTGLVAAVTAGTATITATSERKSGSAAITVSTGPLVSVTVLPGAASLSQGDSLQLQSILRDSVGDTLGGGPSVVWSTGAASVATVSAAGLVKGVSIGRATISATSEGKQGNATIAVLQAPIVGNIYIGNLPSDLAPGATLQLHALFRDFNGNVLPGSPVTWSSDNTSAATVDPTTGIVTGVAGGLATITAQADRFSPGHGSVYVVALARVTETDLGDLGGGTATAEGISNGGVVVGLSTTPSGATHAFRWTAGGGMVDLGTLGGASSYAVAINEVGQIAGASVTASGAQHAVLWSSAQGMQDLGLLPGGTTSGGVAINGGGEVVGSSDDGSGAIRAVRWSASGVIQQVSGDTAQARGINDAEQVVGTAFGSFDICDTSGCYPQSAPFAFSWTAAAGLVDLGLGWYSDALAINSRGDIVGDLLGPATNATTAYLKSAAGSLQLLAFLPGGSYGVALAVNTNGQVAGLAQSVSSTHPVFWPDAATVELLSDSTGAASGVNDLQQIVGTVTDNGRQRAKLWTLSPTSPSKPRAGAATSRRRVP